MLFDSTLRRELARTFGGTLVVILTIVLTIMFIRNLGQAAMGRISPQDVILLLGYVALGHLPTMLALSLFIAVVATLSRMYRASEMTIWFASGVPLSRFVRPVLSMSWPVLLLITALSLFVWPWQNERSAILKDQFESRSDLSRVAPGQFQTSGDGLRTFFFEGSASDPATGRNVFIVASRAGVESVTSAKSGAIQSDGDGRFVILNKGQRNEQNMASGEKTLSRFETYRAEASERARNAAAGAAPRVLPTADLLRNPSAPNQGELAWRLGLVLAAANMLVLGIGLSASNPRHASNWNLLFALLGFFAYYNLISLSQAWVATGRVSLGSALLVGHGGAFLLALGVLWWRENGMRRVVPARRHRRRRLRADARGMRTVRRLFYVDIVSAVVFVALAFLALFFFIDYVDELRDVGTRGYSAANAALYCLLLAPAHLYELMPIAVLIGTIYALARLAQTSQYTILRTGGLGPGRALWLLTSLALVLGAFTFVVGDYVAPFTARLGTQLRAAFSGGLKLGRSGAWIKEHSSGPGGERSYSINVASAERGTLLRDVRIFEFDPDGRLLSRTAAAQATVGRDGTWALDDVTVTSWVEAGAASTAREERLAHSHWRSSLSPSVVAAAVLPVTTMSTIELWRYIGHLSENEQAAEMQKIQFWNRALYPFVCLVKDGLALPYAYLHPRSGGVSMKVFAGIMLGVSFVLLNNVFRHLGLLGNWTPWIVAATPGALYLVMSLAAFSWLVRFR